MEILDVKSREGDCEAETSLLDKRAHTSSKKNREVKNFKGAKEQTLANFVEQYPEMKSYLQLLNELMQFTFRCEVKFGEFSRAVQVFAVSTLHQLSTFGGAQLKVWSSLFPRCIYFGVSTLVVRS